MSSQIYPNWVGTVAAIQVNSNNIAPPANFNDSSPAAPTGNTNVSWNFGSSDVSGLKVSDNFSVSINSTPYSDDYAASVNSVDQNFLVNSSVPQNSKPIFVNGA